MSYELEIDAIREMWRQRNALHKAEKSLTLQMMAICRHASDPGKEFDEATRFKVSKKDGTALFKSCDDGNTNHPLYPIIYVHLSPFFRARELIATSRADIESKMNKIAKKLPTSAWATSIKGIAIGSVAAIIGEAGDLSNYDTISRLWKRMGLAVIGSVRQGKVAGEAALDHGYSPRRRSVMWNIGSGLIGGMGHGPRPLCGEDVSNRIDLSFYQKLFIEQCRCEVAKNTDMGRPPVENDQGFMRESYSAHCSARAKRYVEKRFLLDLWRAWRANELADAPVAMAA